MPSIQVKNVPDDVHLVLRTRAAQSGQSLQEYLLAELTRLGRTKSISEVLDRVEHRSGGRMSLRRATSDIRADRHRR